MMIAAMSATTLFGQDAKQIADNLTVPTEIAGGSKLVLPKAEGAKVELLGADYEQIISKNGPLEEKLTT